MEDEKIYLMSILRTIKELKKGRRRLYDTFQPRFRLEIIIIVFQYTYAPRKIIHIIHLIKDQIILLIYRFYKLVI